MWCFLGGFVTINLHEWYSLSVGSQYSDFEFAFDAALARCELATVDDVASSAAPLLGGDIQCPPHPLGSRVLYEARGISEFGELTDEQDDLI